MHVLRLFPAESSRRQTGVSSRIRFLIFFSFYNMRTSPMQLSSRKSSLKNTTVQSCMRVMNGIKKENTTLASYGSNIEEVKKIYCILVVVNCRMFQIVSCCWRSRIFTRQQNKLSRTYKKLRRKMFKIVIALCFSISCANFERDARFRIFYMLAQIIR